MKIKTLSEEDQLCVASISPSFDDDIISCLQDICIYLERLERKQNEIIMAINFLLPHSDAKTETNTTEKG